MIPYHFLPCFAKANIIRSFETLGGREKPPIPQFILPKGPIRKRLGVSS